MKRLKEGCLFTYKRKESMHKYSEKTLRCPEARISSARRKGFSRKFQYAQMPGTGCQWLLPD